MNKDNLMLQKNITRDFLLLDLYKEDLVFYFAPSSVFLSTISTSIILNLYLNDKISINSETKDFKIIDQTSIRTYNKTMMEYIEKNKITNLHKLAQQLFLDTDFVMDLFEYVIKEFEKDDIIEVKSEKRLVLHKNIVKLKDKDSVKKAYQGLYESLFLDDEANEFVALALLIDTFYSVDDYFSEDEHGQIKERLKELQETQLYSDIKVFKDVIEDFFSLIASRNTNYFGI
ncbi:hypothetical protein [Mycoplasma sp. P36-A1]|uniref:hypothetical protein n=1 Tax=Mycoplasma sp. P36-A1 TaxID=3252900 RepID=UPI003C30964E